MEKIMLVYSSIMSFQTKYDANVNLDAKYAMSVTCTVWQQ